MDNNTHTSLGTLKVSGKDAASFLQGQLTCDIYALKPSTHQLGAFCNRQGRVLALMDIFQLAEDYYLNLPVELIDTIQKELQKYIVFSKVKIENISSDYIIDLSPNFLLDQMRAQIPFIGQAQMGAFLPHPLGLIKLGAISFTKGCFVGQEIIARMQHRTTITKELRYIEIKHPHMPLPLEKIDLEDNPASIVVNSLLIAPETYATLMILECKMLYTTTH